MLQAKILTFETLKYTSQPSPSSVLYYFIIYHMKRENQYIKIFSNSF